jgi:hypothetical protein
VKELVILSMAVRGEYKYAYLNINIQVFMLACIYVFVERYVHIIKIQTIKCIYEDMYVYLSIPVRGE